MPELPEVETVRAGLAPHLTGRRITALQLNRAGLRVPFSPGMSQKVAGARVVSVGRRAKYLLFGLDHGLTLIGHLGMSGTMVLVPQTGYHPRPHDHVLIDIDSGLRLVFNDPRRFGLLISTATDALDAHPLLASLAPEPFDAAFSATYLQAQLATRKSAIKPTIMDQRVVVGVGNIYASEALFRARIHPMQPACSLKPAAIGALRDAMIAVLREAIDSGGSTLRDYVRSSGDAGYFQHHFAVYDKAGTPCERCKTPITHRVQQGRSSYFCDKCQKLKQND